MRIQHIGFSIDNKFLIPGRIITSKISEPNSLDEFDINVIDLSNKYMWYNNSDSVTSCNSMSDFENLYQMINKSNKSKIVIVYPQNCSFEYSYGSISKKYQRSCQLKNMLDSLRKSLIYVLIGNNTVQLFYENTKTRLGDKDYNASFYFDTSEALTKSVGSEKATTIELGDFVLTTLNITTNIELIDFLKNINLINEKEEIPEWVREMNWFNDEKIKHEIDEKKELIRSAQSYIMEAKYGLDENNKYKSILYTNGDELVNVVFKILENIFNYDLSTFLDEKKEDFIIKLDDITFIGEIKGINTNIKSGNVSQLDVHLHNYLENPATETKKVKSLLIINHQRNKPLAERESVHETQIKLAERNGGLIIETSTLLSIFEKFKKGELKTKEIKQMFIKKIGLLE